MIANLVIHTILTLERYLLSVRSNIPFDKFLQGLPLRNRLTWV